MIGIAILFVAIYYLLTSSPKDAAIFASASGAAAGTILAAFDLARVLSHQMLIDKKATNARSEALAQQRREFSLSLGSRWTDPHMQHSRATCRKVADLKVHSLQELKLALNTYKKQSNVLHLPNFFLKRWR